MKKLFVAVALAGGILFQSCKKDNNNNNGSSAQNAQMSIRLTDAPGDYDAVNVNIQSISVNHETKGWIDIPVQRPGMYNLLDLRNGTDVLLCQGDIPPGRINQIRLTLGSGNTVMVKGMVYELNTPSAEESGLKLNVDQSLDANTAYSFWLDFDAGKSVVETGSGKYMLKPVIRSYTQLTDGRIKGYFSFLYPGTIVYAINGADTFSTYPDKSGSFMFCGLPEANYTLHIETASTLTLDVPGVAVKFGSVTDVGVLTLRP